MSLLEALPDTDLVGKTLDGDTAAFVTLCERHRARVWRIASSVARAADAEDLAQEVVLRAYRSLRGYGGQAPFAAWLCRIAVNAARDYQRSAWRRRVMLADDAPRDETPSEDLERTAERRETQRRVRRAVASLPDQQAAPIWLHYFEGFSMAEVARLEGLPEGTIRSRMRAGLKRLSASLQDLITEPEGLRTLEARAGES